MDHDRPLSHDEKRFLLELARSTLESRLGGETLPSPSPAPGPVTEVRGAFVTLTASGQLRGCIGHVEGVVPLWRSVQDNAIAAALQDPRFPPVTADELPRLSLEISALTPLRQAHSPDEIEIGYHGIMLKHQGRRGLLLPQVATSYGWDRETFLDHTCRKAGMPAGEWREPDVEILLFAAEVFGEED
jgi:AmmeMemoRadiSam system protein A